jgi:hypothetical protein
MRHRASNLVQQHQRLGVGPRRRQLTVSSGQCFRKAILYDSTP